MIPGYIRFGLDTKSEEFEITGIGLTLEECDAEPLRKEWEHSITIPIGTGKLEVFTENWLKKHNVRHVERVRIIAKVCDEVRMVLNLLEQKNESRHEEG